MDMEVAASNIQRIFRGHYSRVTAAHARETELVFIGMQLPKRKSALESEINNGYRKRKQEQADNKDSVCRLAAFPPIG